MYIQPQQEGERPVIPDGYRGNAFPREPVPPTPEEVPVQEVPQDDPPTAEAFAPAKERDYEEKRQGHARFPFLSALLPPPRREGKGGLPDWAILAAVAVLFFSEDGESDILPFLLLLLLWD